jgi:hypothetical protein
LNWTEDERQSASLTWILYLALAHTHLEKVVRKLEDNDMFHAEVFLDEIEAASASLVNEAVRPLRREPLLHEALKMLK